MPGLYILECPKDQRRDLSMSGATYLKAHQRDYKPSDRYNADKAAMEVMRRGDLTLSIETSKEGL
jgi:hypothetical protein